MDTEESDRRFPRTARYSPEWISENGFGGNALWQAEFLCERLNLKPGMRVLDLGCGRAKSSVFFALEFGVQATSQRDDLGQRTALFRLAPPASARS